MQGMGLVDTQCTLNQDVREYSFYSPVHNSYTCIDLMLMPSPKIHQVTSCEFLARTLLDHAALLVTIPTSTPITRCTRWKFTSHILNDTEFVDMINREIDLF